MNNNCYENLNQYCRNRDYKQVVRTKEKKNIITLNSA